MILFAIWVIVIIILSILWIMLKAKEPIDHNTETITIFAICLWPVCLLGIILGLIVALIAEYVFGKEYL